MVRYTEDRTGSLAANAVNSVARNRQQVRTLVGMTQIRQWHMCSPEASGFTFDLFR